MDTQSVVGPYRVVLQSVKRSEAGTSLVAQWQKKKKKNPPDKAEDTGSMPGPERSHRPRCSCARAPRLLSLRSRAREPQVLKPMHLEAVSCNEKPPQWEACSLQPRSLQPEGSPAHCSQRQSPHGSKDAARPERKGEKLRGMERCHALQHG